MEANALFQVENEQKNKEVERQSKLLSDSLEALEKMQRDHQKELAEASARFEADRRDLQVRAGALEARLRLLEQTPDNCPVSTYRIGQYLVLGKLTE